MPIPVTTPPPRPLHAVVPRHRPAEAAGDGQTLRIVPWADPVADPHGVDPCSRYVELYWLGVVGPSTTWLLRRLNYGLEVHGDGYDLHLPETARSLGLGDKMGRNSPFRRALARLTTFELARAQGPGELAVRTRIPPLPLRHLSRLPESLQRSHRRWMAEQQLPEAEQMRRRALRLATGLADAGHDRSAIERRLAQWQFHPAVAFQAAGAVCEGRGDQEGGRGHVTVGARAAADAVPGPLGPVQPLRRHLPASTGATTPGGTSDRELPTGRVSPARPRAPRG